MNTAGHARRADQFHRIALQLLADANILRRVLEREDIRERDARLQRVERVGVLLRGQDGDFLGWLHVAQRELHREPVHLRLRQRIRAAKLDWVLRRDDKEEF